MTNQSDNRYEIKVVIRVDTSSYDGRAAYPVKKREAMILLKPAEGIYFYTTLKLKILLKIVIPALFRIS